jgi:hypothetical protein
MVHESKVYDGLSSLKINIKLYSEQREPYKLAHDKKKIRDSVFGIYPNIFVDTTLKTSS